MDLYLDSASLADLEPLLATGLFRGVTTNPLILQRAGVRLDEVPDLVRTLQTLTGEVFVQARTARDVAAILDDARALRALGDTVVVKVAATRDGLTAVRRLSDDGVPTLVTAVYDTTQAVLAQAAGARWIAPYLGRMSDAGRDSLAEARRMTAALEGSGTRVLAASVRSVEVVGDLAAAGVDAATVGVAVARDLFTHEATARAVAEFDAAVAALR
ncbi:MAG: hypothetical protein KQH57_14030 [Actinomycetales bacterium]|nr:hypothetical protein [Actinomycetales bacterium]